MLFFFRPILTKKQIKDENFSFYKLAYRAQETDNFYNAYNCKMKDCKHCEDYFKKKAEKL